MGRKSEEKAIRGRTFRVTQLPGMKGTKLFYRLSAIVIPSLMKAGKALEILDLNADLGELAAVGPELFTAASFLFDKLPEAEFEKLIREMLENATVQPLDGSPEQPLMPIFDEELAGETSTVLQLVAFALKVNFGNFMPGLVARARALQGTKAVSDSKESTT
jgi:hypothetical protein